MGQKLSQRRIEAAKTPSAGQILIRDGELRGFALRVTPNGCKTFVWDGRVNGQMRRLTLGRYPELSLIDARAKALEIRHQISAGVDPGLERLRQREEPTIGQLAMAYIERHARPHKRSWVEDERKIRLHFTPLAALKVSALTTEMVVHWHLQIGKGSGEYMANRCLALLATMFSLANQWRLVATNPTRGIKRFREEKRERFLNAEEINRLLVVLHEEDSPYWSAYFRLAILLGCRKTELLNARWQDINIDDAIWRIPQTKAGRPHRLPLPRPSIAILESLPSRGQSDWLFPSDKRPGHRLSRADDAWQRIRQTANIPDVRIHDLRRTLGSWLAAQGCSLPLIGKTLNHADVSTTAIYARLNLDPVRQALEINARQMLKSDSTRIRGR